MRAFEPRGIRLQTRILSFFIPVLVGAVALIVTVVELRKSDLLMDMSRERGMAVAQSLKAAASSQLLSYNYVALQSLADRAVQEGGVSYVIILDKEGNVAGYSGRPEWQGQTLRDTPSRAAFDSRQSLVQRVDHPALGPATGFDVAVPVFVENSPIKWGTVRVGLSLNEVYAEQKSTRIAILALGLFVLGLAFLITRLLARRIIDPIGRLVKATDELARGNYDHRVGIDSGDEIGHLAHRFDDMAREIRSQQVQVKEQNRELAGLNSTLESKVEERTRALGEAEEKYRLLVDHSPNPICIIRDGELLFFNRALAETFGYEERDLSRSGFGLESLLDEEHRPAFLDLLLNPPPSHDSEETPRMETVGLRRDGTRIYLDMRYAWITYLGAPALELILVDVTERRELQEKAVSGERLRALGEMASGVAHDFNNILGTILARAQFLQHKTDDQEVQRGLRIIEKAAGDGGATVKRIQDFSRVRKDRSLSHADINSVLEDVVEMTRNVWEDAAQRKGKRISLLREFGPSMTVQGNVHELREVFMNLVLNAVDAIPESGVITLGTGEVDGKVEITLRDTGSGMTEEVKKRLFDPFFSTKGVKGTGLGMSIVYGIVTRHGGGIEVESEEGAGSLFRLTLPLATEKPDQPEAPTSAPMGGTGRVLVVDDEDAIRALAEDILVESGYDVCAVATGAQAVDRAAKEHFDVLLTDLGMPEMNGWEVSREVRRKRPDIGILLFTGWGATLDPKEVTANGINRALQKPFGMTELLEAVADLIADGQRRRAA